MARTLETYRSRAADTLTQLGTDMRERLGMDVTPTSPDQFPPLTTTTDTQPTERRKQRAFLAATTTLLTFANPATAEALTTSGGTVPCLLPGGNQTEIVTPGSYLVTENGKPIVNVVFGRASSYPAIPHLVIADFREEDPQNVKGTVVENTPRGVFDMNQTEREDFRIGNGSAFTIAATTYVNAATISCQSKTKA